MNYNEYDSNRKKKNFNLSEILNDKQKRSRFFLAIYLIIFIILIVFVRLNLSSTQDLNKEKTNKENVINEEKTNNVQIEEVVKNDDMFSFIDLNNYDFKYIINMDTTNTSIVGKRYNDKYEFSLDSNGSVLFFNGTTNYIRARETIDGEYKITGFPYVLVNIFDNNVVKKIINNSELKDNVYEITTEKLGAIVGNNNLNNKEEINTIELVKRNNKVTEINMDLSNAISSYMNNKTKAIIKLEYSNFGLIDDFKIE